MKGACSKTEVVYGCSSIGKWVYITLDLATNFFLDLIIILSRMGFMVIKGIRGICPASSPISGFKNSGVFDQ